MEDINTFEDDYISDEELYSDVVESPGSGPVVYDWSSPAPDGGARTVSSEQQAIDLCTAALTGAAGYTECQAQVPTSIILDECVMDVYVSGSI